MKDRSTKRKTPTWVEVSEINKRLGWFTELMSENKIIFERGSQRIEVKRIPSCNKWKVEYYSGKIMDDTSGVENERDAKIDTIEMAVLK